MYLKPLFRSIINKYVSCSDKKNFCFDGRNIGGNARKLSYLEWSTQFQGPSSNDSDLTSRLLRAETDRGDAETEPSRTAIKLKSKDGLVRADFFKASSFRRKHEYNYNTCCDVSYHKAFYFSFYLIPQDTFANLQKLSVEYL